MKLMTHLKLHAPAPDFTLQTVAGEPLRLADILAGGQHALLVFLRHLG